MNKLENLSIQVCVYVKERESVWVGVLFVIVYGQCVCGYVLVGCVWGGMRERAREREKGHTSWLLTLLREFGLFDSNDPGRASDSVKSV